MPFKVTPLVPISPLPTSPSRTLDRQPLRRALAPRLTWACASSAALIFLMACGGRSVAGNQPSPFEERDASWWPPDDPLPVNDGGSPIGNDDPDDDRNDDLDDDRDDDLDDDRDDDADDDDRDDDPEPDPSATSGPNPTSVPATTNIPMTATPMPSDSGGTPSTTASSSPTPDPTSSNGAGGSGGAPPVNPGGGGSGATDTDPDTDTDSEPETETDTWSETDPDTNGGCEQERYEYTDGCEIYTYNCNEYESSSCYRNGNDWTCSCSTNTMYFSNLRISGVSEAITSCDIALDTCLEPPSFPADLECDQTGFSSQSSYCTSTVTCSSSVDLGNGVTIAQDELNYVECSSSGDTWWCGCSYPSSGNYSSYDLDVESSTDACEAGALLCEEGFIAPVDQTCSEYETDSGTRSCNASRTCEQTLPVGDGVQISANEYSDCSLEGDTWVCTCSGSNMPTLRAIEPSTTVVTEVCAKTAALCSDAQWLESSGEITCEASSTYVSTQSCDVSLECYQPIPIEGGNVSASSYVYLSCYDQGSDAWYCNCNDADESVTLELLPGDDVWESCTAKAQECVNALSVDFGR